MDTFDFTISTELAEKMVGKNQFRRFLARFKKSRLDATSTHRPEFGSPIDMEKVKETVRVKFLTFILEMARFEAKCNANVGTRGQWLNGTYSDRSFYEGRIAEHLMIKDRDCEYVDLLIELIREMKA